MARNRALGMLFGREPGRTRRLSALGLGIFVVITVAGFVMRAVGFDGLLAWLATETNALVLAVAVVLLTAASAYHNDGVLVCCALAFAPIFALFLNYVGVGYVGEPTALTFIGLAVGFGLVYAVPLGTLGFVLGAGGRRLVGRYGRPSE